MIQPAFYQLDRDKRIWYLSPMRAAKVQASLRIRADSSEPSLLAHTSSESRGTFRQKARSLAPLNGKHAQLKFVMTECSKTQIRLTGLNCSLRETSFPEFSGADQNIRTVNGFEMQIVNFANSITNKSFFSLHKSVKFEYMSHVMRKPVFAICEQ